MIPLSVLDLSLITEGDTATDALRRSADLAQHAEALGYKRYWVAEHHAMPGIASAATAIVISHIAQHTTTIRVGAGGIMLPNHAPLAVAEAFGTLDALYPGRIDLGLGRAPGSDQATMRALRRDPTAAERFPQDVVELLNYFAGTAPITAIPGHGAQVPVWLLGSSLFSAHLAAILGLPFAFASHFAPDSMEEAIALYRHRFEASAYLERPHVMLSCNAIVGETTEQALHSATSLHQYFIALRQGRPTAFPEPRITANSPAEAAMIERTLRYTFTGTADDVAAQIATFAAAHQPDELLIAAPIFDHQTRRDTLSALAQNAIAQR